MGKSLSIQGTLDFGAALPVDSWLPDETLFSLASRYHIVSCNHLDANTSLQLFGHRSVATRHDIPSRVDVFVEKTHGELGGAVEVIFEHTLLPFYFPLKSKKQMEDAVGTMRKSGGGSLKYRLGMLANRFQANHPLKACKLCMKEDVERFRVAYWHRIHQYPGVWICPHHDHLLVESSKPRARGGYGWCLPREDVLAHPTSPSPSIFDRERYDLLRQLSFASIALAALAPNVYLDQARIARIYMRRLVSMGMREVTGKLRLDDCTSSILQVAAPLRAIGELTALPASRDEARAFVSRLCWERIESAHPLRHLFTMVWPFRGWDHFRATYDRDVLSGIGMGNVATHPSDVPQFHDPNATYRGLLEELKIEEGLKSRRKQQGAIKARRDGG